MRAHFNSEDYAWFSLCVYTQINDHFVLISLGLEWAALPRPRGQAIPVEAGETRNSLNQALINHRTNRTFKQCVQRSSPLKIA